MMDIKPDADGLYRFKVMYGHAAIDEPRPGFSRYRVWDGAGNLTHEETNHYVCVGTTHCMYCGREFEREPVPPTFLERVKRKIIPARWLGAAEEIPIG